MSWPALYWMISSRPNLAAMMLVVTILLGTMANEVCRSVYHFCNIPRVYSSKMMLLLKASFYFYLTKFYLDFISNLVYETLAFRWHSRGWRGAKQGVGLSTRATPEPATTKGANARVLI